MPVWVYPDGLQDLTPITTAVYGLIADACTSVPPEACDASAAAILEAVCTNAPPEVCGYRLEEMICPNVPEACAAVGL